MPAPINLKDRKFERLTALYPTDKRDTSGSIIWVCECECGNIVNVSSKELLSGSTKSCGCLTKERISKLKYKDLTGMRFGRLKVIRETSERKNGSIVWECECKCGNTVKVISRSLIQENTKSCGCLNLETCKKSMKEKADADSVDGTRLSYLNKTIFENNTSGVRGVTFSKVSSKWAAYITFKKKHYHLGLFENIDDAAYARELAEKLLWEPFVKGYIGDFSSDEERKEKLQKYIKEKIEEKHKIV